MLAVLPQFHSNKHSEAAGIRQCLSKNGPRMTFKLAHFCSRGSAIPRAYSADPHRLDTADIELNKKRLTFTPAVA